MKKKKITISSIFVCMALFAFYVGVKNLKDVLALRDEINLHLTSYGSKLLLIYDHLLHVSYGFITIGVICLYIAWKKLRSYKCRCGWMGMSTYKYCPDCGREICADNEL